MSELKRCPFCGCSPVTDVEIAENGPRYHVDFTVRCNKCGTYKTVRLNKDANCDFSYVENAMTNVIEAWNRRANDEQ